MENEVFTITQMNYDSGEITAELQLNTEHSVFEGHFPGNPVLPGVCMIEMIKELTEKATATRCMLSKASNIKFLQVVRPAETNSLSARVTCSVKENTIQVKGVLFAGTITFFKLDGNFSIQHP